MLSSKEDNMATALFKLLFRKLSADIHWPTYMLIKSLSNKGENDSLAILSTYLPNYTQHNRNWINLPLIMLSALL